MSQQMVLRDNSLGSQQATGQQSAGLGLTGKGANKFINPTKMPISTNYVHRMSGGMPIDGTARMNDILLESQKMIYAPPSREKTKQSMRSPMLEKGKN